MNEMTKTKLLDTRKNRVFKVSMFIFTLALSALAAHYGSDYLGKIDPSLEKGYTFSLIFFPLEFILVHVGFVVLKTFIPE